jgi:ABC-type sugar transport system, periplasmic component
MRKKVIALTLCIMMLSGLAACGKATDKQGAGSEGDTTTKESTEVSATEGEIEIPIILNTGTNDALDMEWGEVVEAFNEEYAGKYRIEVEKLAGAAEDYRQKIKMLNSAESLPSILFGMGTEPAFLDLLINNDRLVDIEQYMTADANWTSHLMPQAIEEFKTDKGTFLVPVTGVQMAGVYYNKELFEEAGINGFPETWEDFLKACEDLKGAGITPISLHTMETAWCGMLVATANMAATETGRKFLEEQFPSSYDNQEFRDGIEMMVRLFKDYSTEDAVGGSYALASNHFFAGNTAMIPNGPWMMESLTDTSYAEEGFENKVGYAAFPGNAMQGFLGQQAMAISKDHPQEVIDGAIEFVKFYHQPEYILRAAEKTGSMPTAVELEKETIEKMILPMQEYVECAKNVDIIFPNYQNKWDPIAQQDIFGRELPNLIYESIDMDEFITMLDEGAAQYQLDIE